MARFLVVLILSVVAWAQDAQNGLHRIFSGKNCLLRFNGVDYGQSADCHAVAELKIPSEAERKSGAPITLRLKVPNASAPVLTLTLNGASQHNDANRYLIDYEVKSITGGALEVLPTDVLRCGYARMGIMTPQEQESLGCKLVRNGATSEGLFNFGFFVNDSSRLGFRGGAIAAYEALSGQKWSSVPTQVSGTRAAPVPARTTAGSTPSSPAASSSPTAPSSPAAPSGKTVLSTDPKAIFGMMVGTQRPAMPFCPNETSNMPAEVPLCRSQAGADLASILGALKSQPNVIDHEKMGLTMLSVFVNRRVFDTKFTDNVLVYVDNADVMQRIKISPYLVADQEVMSMLTMKFGQPSKQTTTTWTSPQGGVVSQSPNYFWTFPKVLVDYFTRDTTILDKRSTAGGIDVYTPEYLRLADDYQKRRGAPAAGKKGI